MAPTSADHRIRPWRWALALVALVVIARARTVFIEGLDTDETIFHTVAARMLDGDRLYADVYDVKPPGIYFFYALVQILFGPGLGAVHHVTTVVVLLTAWVIARTVYRVSDDARAGLFAAALYFIFHGVGDASTGAGSSTEQIAALPVALGMHTRLSEASPRRALFAGALFALATLFKVQASAAAVAAAIAIALCGERRLLSLCALSLGVTVPLVATWGVFAAQGLGDEMLRWSLWEGLRYASEGSPNPWQEFPNLLAYLGLQFPCCVGAVIALRRHAIGFHRLLLGSWIALAMLASAAGWRFYWNYFILLSVPLATAAGIAAPAIWDRLRRPLRVGVLAVSLLPSLASQAWLVRQEVLGHGSLRAGHRHLAREARLRLPAGGRLIAFGSAAPIYYLTRTTPPMPYLVTDHMFRFVDPYLLRDPNDIRDYVQPERLETLLRSLARPDVHVVVDSPYSAWKGCSLERVPQVAAVVIAHFEIAYRSAYGAVWVRRPRA